MSHHFRLISIPEPEPNAIIMTSVMKSIGNIYVPRLEEKGTITINIEDEQKDEAMEIPENTCLIDENN